MQLKKFKVTYESEGTILQRPTEMIEAHDPVEAEQLAKKATEDWEHVEEYMQPIVMVKVKKIEEVL
jgi:hypothetical protein